MKPASLRSLILACLLSAVAGPAWGQNTKANEGGDLAFGGPGSEPGKFLELRDITFDAQGNLYALDGVRPDPKTKAPIGNLRVQKFSDAGKLLATIDLRDEATGAALGAKNDPQRLAVDVRGHVFVTQPAAGLVQEFGPDGKLLRSIPVPAAQAITTWKTGADQRLAVVASRKEVVKGKWQWLGGDEIVLLSPAGQVERKIALTGTGPLQNVQDIAADRAGNFYVQAEPNAVYEFSPEGKLLKTLGGNPTTRNEDGSELLHTVAVDSKGNVYAMTWGNPGLVTRFDADGTQLTQRGGQFQWADPWSVHSSYTVLALDPHDRLWAAATHLQNPQGPHYHKQRAVPAIVRTRPDFFTDPPGAVRHTPLRRVGYRPTLTCGLPFNIAYEPGQAVPMVYQVAAANRSVKSVTIEWHAYDALKQPVGHGTFELPLTNGAAAKADFSFTPAKFGSYFVVARARSAEGDLGAIGEHVGVTPDWPGLPALKAAESKGGWEDPVRQLWTGLPNMRLHPSKSLDKLDHDLREAEKVGATVIVQLVDNVKKFDADEVRKIAERFKGRLKYVEVCNEPNFSGSIDDYFKIHKQAYDIIKAVDPSVRIMGPATVNMDLNWLRRLYELGFKDVVDIISLHDYEGHESISPEHWRWKLGEVRQILAKYGDEKKPIWQTERAIAGVRGQDFQGLVQAIRATLHRDLLETLGIPSEHDNFYYLNQGGYSSVPSYLWSKNGPHPGALALRTRHALTTARDRRYADTLDFGPSGLNLVLGVRYAGKDGATISLRNLGTRDLPLEFGVSGTDRLELVDAWGNTALLPVQDGRIKLTLTQLPSYLLVPGNARITPPRLDFGPNLARTARASYSGLSKSDPALLTNGILETYHAGNPNGDTNGQKIWTGDLPGTLELAFAEPTTFGRVVVHGVRPDNTFCALLAYDLEYFDGKGWQTIEKLQRPMPASEEVQSADAVGAVWMDDTNFFLHQFPPVTTTRLRLVARNTTFGFLPDDRVRAWGNLIPQRLMLREIEVYPK